MNLKCFTGTLTNLLSSSLLKKNLTYNARLRFHINARFSSENDANSKRKEPGEVDVRKLLENSSPLKRSLTDKTWATMPYTEGTVFQNETDEKDTYFDINVEGLSIIMFPGQGCQYVGMGSELLHYPIVQDMFASAGEVLGYNLLKLCLKGPAAKLNKTEYCQPATLVCSLAALEKLKDTFPAAINKCIGTCGYSVGEIAALVFAGCISFEKAVSLVKIRAEAMQACSDEVPGGMMTVICGADSKLDEALTEARDFCKSQGIENPVCAIACYLFQGCKVIAGHTKALDFIASNYKKYKLRKLSKLPVSGAFHTVLMKEAAGPFLNALRKAEIKPPLVSVLSNVDGKKYHGPDEIVKKLPKQIYSPVKWEQLLQQVYSRKQGMSFPSTFECGPGSSLSSILKKINAKAALNCHAISV